LQERGDRRVQVEAAFGQPVLEARRPVLVATALEDPVLRQLPEPCREGVAGDPGVVLELVEPPDPMNASRSTRKVQRSPMISRVRATG
jgi:hypothetical protein